MKQSLLNPSTPFRLCVRRIANSVVLLPYFLMLWAAVPCAILAISGPVFSMILFLVSFVVMIILAHKAFESFPSHPTFHWIETPFGPNERDSGFVTIGGLIVACIIYLSAGLIQIVYIFPK